MPGYRQHSFDPNAYVQQGRPLRPFNWVQWTGVALVVAGMAVLVGYFAGRAGLIPEWIDTPAASTALCVAGALLVNSRREPGTPVGTEQLQRNRKILLITIVLLAAILGAALVIEFKGA